ncbi:MAG TPA: hypothetical protein VHH55_05430 [Gaiellaceae bacterium]|jgi:hypothetical protein|nr:hypothetical protein [Gaiellaceae bacterium]
MIKEERLAGIRQRIDDLEARARTGTAEQQARLQRTFEALQEDEQAARAAVDQRADAAEEKLVDLETRVEIAAKRVAAELSDDAASYADAVEAELDVWDDAIERFQARAAVKAQEARGRAEADVAELRRARNRAAERLAEARSSTGEALAERKQRVSEALDELDQKARDTTAKDK